MTSSPILLRSLRVAGAILSIGGSTCIIAHVIIGKRFKKSPLHRLLLGLSSVDILHSLFMAIAAAFIYPINSPSNYCTTDAFIMMMLGTASPLYTAAMSYYFCATVVFDVSVERFAKRYEPILHFGLVLAVTVAAAVSGLFFEVYNPKESGMGCWVGKYPSGCNTEKGGGDEDEEDGDVCIRGGDVSARVIQYLASVLPMCFALFSIFFNNALIYRKMRKLEIRNRRYTAATEPTPSGRKQQQQCPNFPFPFRSRQQEQPTQPPLDAELAGRRPSPASTAKNSNNEKQLLSRKIATQSFCYVAAFLMSYGWGFFHFAILSAGTNVVPIQAINFFLYPAHGFFNAIVYARPTYLRWRDGGETRIMAIRKALFSLQSPSVQQAQSLQRRRQEQQKQQQKHENKDAPPPRTLCLTEEDGNTPSSTEGRQEHPDCSTNGAIILKTIDETTARDDDDDTNNNLDVV